MRKKNFEPSSYAALVAGSLPRQGVLFRSECICLHYLSHMKQQVIRVFLNIFIMSAGPMSWPRFLACQELDDLSLILVILSRRFV